MFRPFSTRGGFTFARILRFSGRVVFAITRFAKVILSILALCLGWVSFSQDALGQAGAPDPGFQAEQISVSQTCLQSDGKILVVTDGGTSAANPSNLAIVRLNTDGSVDATFNQSDESLAVNPTNLTSANGYIYLIFRSYSSSGGFIGTVLRRYSESTGQVDAAFSAVTVPGQNITGYLVQPDGRILVWGDALYRRNADGTMDSSFQSPDSSLNNTLTGVSITGTGSLYVWGDFTTIGTATRNGIARLNGDGSLDTGFVPATNQGSYAFNLFQEPTGTVLASIWDPVSARHTLIRMKSDGTAVSSFQSPTFYFIENTSYSFTETSDQKIMVWGNGIVEINQTSVDVYARLNADGSVDTTFTANEPGGAINNVLVQPDGKLVMCGDFAQLGVPMIRLNEDGTLDPSFNMVPGNQISGLAQYQAYAPILQPDGKILTALIPPFTGGDDDGGGGTVTIGPPPPPPILPPDYIVRYDGYGNYVPQPVLSLTVDAVSPQVTHIAWTAAPDVTDYQIQREESGQWVVKATVGANVTSYDDTAVDGVTNFPYRIVAQNTIGSALPSQAIAAGVPAGAASYLATATSPTQVSLSWTPSADAWQYVVYRTNLSDSNSVRTEIATLPASAMSYVDNVAAPLQDYEYDLVASNMVGQTQSTAYTSTPDNLPPVTPDNFEAGPVKANQIGLVLAHISGSHRISDRAKRRWHGRLAAGHDRQRWNCHDLCRRLGAIIRPSLLLSDYRDKRAGFFRRFNRRLRHRAGFELESTRDVGPELCAQPSVNRCIRHRARCFGNGLLPADL